MEARQLEEIASLPSSAARAGHSRHRPPPSPLSAPDSPKASARRAFRQATAHTTGVPS